MIYTPLTIKAMKVAYRAHHGQEDAGGIPYIFHPIHLAEQMNSEIMVCAALLHDVVEDTNISLEELKQEFPKEVVDIVELLTHQPKEDYFDYVRKIRKNYAARLIKLADLEHNSDESRLTETVNVTKERKALWHEKYKKAQEILMESDPEEYRKLHIIRKELLPQGQEIMKTHRIEVFEAINQMIHICQRARKEGLYAIEEEAAELIKSKIFTEQFLAIGLEGIIKRTIPLPDRMLGEYFFTQRKLSERFIMYIYIRGVMMLERGEAPQTFEAVFLSMLPIEERDIFLKCKNSASRFKN